MISLGIEGTAHTIGIGIVDDKCNILADVKKIYSPESGGIHPRDASRYIADNFGDAIKEALGVANISKDRIDLVSFSQGPGLGPCLSNVGVGARTLALSLNKPIIGVNHCVAHIEIGNMLARKENPEWTQPLVLYVSGGNTQILMLKDNRYRIFGETLDIGIGNMLDKFGREALLGHPAGPKIEELAKKGKRYIQLPYVVKGNDLSFSGLFTESVKRLRTENLEDLCYSLQETSFAMLTEATERALCHLKSNSLLLTGGVANNGRLREMLRVMSDSNEVNFSVPNGYCGDNGVMIAWTGMVMHNSGVRQDIKDTKVDQSFRTDAVEIGWLEQRDSRWKNRTGSWRGAEALLTLQDGKVEKKRVEKAYRIKELDERLRRSRTSREARLLTKAKAAGVDTPRVIMVSEWQYLLEMEYLQGRALSEVFNQDEIRGIPSIIGDNIQRLHENGIVHGDLTTSNMILGGTRVYFIDFGLGGISQKVEDKATDLLLLKKSINANHPSHFKEIWGGILRAYKDVAVLRRLEEAEKRGRYL
jgi:N6-L-threonylcarbamoyladenine synthase/protein kinase Bud32